MEVGGKEREGEALPEDCDFPFKDIVIVYESS